MSSSANSSNSANSANSNLARQVEFVMRTVEERNIRFVRLWFTDVLGFLKSVAISPAELEAAFEEGIGFDGSSYLKSRQLLESDQNQLITLDISTTHLT